MDIYNKNIKQYLFSFVLKKKKETPCQSKTKTKVAPMRVLFNSTMGFPILLPSPFPQLFLSSLGASGQIIQTVWHILNRAGQLLEELDNMFLYGRQVNCFLGQTGGSHPWLATGSLDWLLSPSSLWLVSLTSALQLLRYSSDTAYYRHAPLHSANPFT